VVNWVRKDLLGIEELSADEINLILDTADSFKEISTRAVKKVPALRGKTIVNLFFEPSTRTRTSFELAAKRLSADTMSIASATSSVVKGETLIDTAKTLESLKVDIIIMRHGASGSSNFLAKLLDASVINAGDGSHEHPTQALLDLYTIKERKGNINGLKVAIVGDILHSRVARSNIWGLIKLGADVTVVAPPTLVPKDIERTGVKVSYTLNGVIEKVDVVNILRIQRERQQTGLFPSIREYAELFCITPEKLKNAKKDVLIMHPGPINRGVEISSEVADGPYSVILDQVTNGLAVRMAVLFLIAGTKPEKE
jgi:aspartate carbamoyltransferase catalytic subunit